MKKGIISLLAASLFTSFLSTANAALPADVMCCGVEIPPFCGGYFFGLTALYWRPRIPQLDFALNFPTDDFLEGVYKSVDPSYKWGYKINFGYTFPCTGNDVQFTFTHFKETDQKRVFEFGGQLLSSLTASTSILVPDVFIATVDPAGGFTLVSPTTPVVVIPATSLNVLTSISAEAKFDEEFMDLDFGQYVLLGSNFRVRGYGGLRYINLENSLSASLESGSQTIPTLGLVTFALTDPEDALVMSDVIVEVDYRVNGVERIINQKSRVTGVGPRFGIDSSYHLGYGIGLVGSVSGSLIVGRILSSLLVDEVNAVTAEVTAIFTSFTNPPIEAVTIAPPAVGDVFIGDDPQTISFFHPKTTRIIPNIDAKLGFDYTYQFCYNRSQNITLEVGYMISFFWNVIDRLSADAASTPEFHRPETMDLGLGGPYISLIVDF